MRIRFGCHLPQEVPDFEKLVLVAQECERLGYDSVWTYDHLSPFWGKSRGALECWTLLAAIAQRTDTIRLGTLVTNVNLRNPALLAKMASTLDNISNGRLILGLGTGDRMSRDELLSFGYGFARTEERIERLHETIKIVKSMWGESEASFEGKHFGVHRAINFPKPVQKPHPPIWIGGKHRRILDIVADEADGWNYWGLDKETLAERIQYLNERCTRIGRPPETIVRSWAGTFVDALRKKEDRSNASERILSLLRDQTDKETRYFIASFGARAEPETYNTFAETMSRLQ